MTSVERLTQVDDQERAQSRLVAEIDGTLGNPNYSGETRLALYQGKNRVREDTSGGIQSFREKLSKLWWIRVTENAGAQTNIQNLVGAKYVSLAIGKESKAQAVASLRRPLKQFFAAAEGRASLENDPDAPQAKFKKLQEIGATGDDPGAGANDIRAALLPGGVPGYGSFQWGLTPERTIEMLGVSPESLKNSKIVMAEIRPGEFAQYSLPKGANVFGIDYSSGMVGLAKSRGLNGVQGNVSEGTTWEAVRNEFGQPDVIVADYFLDVAQRPVDALRNMVEALPTGGKLMITILVPIEQKGFASLLFKGSNVDPAQDIGNTKNPWRDVLKLRDVAARLDLELISFSVTSYVQYDAGRNDKDLPGEIRPSGVLVFEKINMGAMERAD